MTARNSQGACLPNVQVPCTTALLTPDSFRLFPKPSPSYTSPYNIELVCKPDFLAGIDLSCNFHEYYGQTYKNSSFTSSHKKTTWFQQCAGYRHPGRSQELPFEILQAIVNLCYGDGMTADPAFQLESSCPFRPILQLQASRLHLAYVSRLLISKHLFNTITTSSNYPPSICIFSTMKTFPEADVIWWNADSYYIRCPFCEAVHCHGVNWNANKLRYSHCEKMESYLCCFPMNDQGEVAYEIDKRRGRYINICVSHDSDTEDDDDVDHLAIELAQKATVAAQREETYADIDEDSKEVVTIDRGHGNESFEQKRFFEPIGDCANGNTRAVQKYLETSSEAKRAIFCLPTPMIGVKTVNTMHVTQKSN